MKLKHLVLFFLLAALPYSTVFSASPELQITHYSPQGENTGQAQIQVVFNKPLTALSTLDDPIRKEVISHFHLEPAVEGNFRLIGTSAVVFEPMRHLPLATNFIVKIDAGIKAIDGSILAKGIEWSFNTPGLAINRIDPNNADHALPSQWVTVTSNQPLKLDFLKKAITFIRTDTNAPVPFILEPAKENPKPEESIGMGRQYYRYILKPINPLPLNRRFQVTVSAGILPEQGNMPTKETKVASFKTYGPLRFERVGPPPYEDFEGRLEPSFVIYFTNRVLLEEINKHTSIKPAIKGRIFETDWYQGNMITGGLEPDTDYEITLLPELTDIYGQKIETPQVVKFPSGNLRPRITVRQGFYLISSMTDPVLPLGAQAITNLNYKIVGLKPEDLLMDVDFRDNYKREGLMSKLSGDYSSKQGVEHRNKPMRHDFDLKPFFNAKGFGAVVYDFYSPEEIRRYSRDKIIHHTGFILRTDLAAHLKISPTEGIVLVNSLSGGGAVRDANIDIYRMEDVASKKPCARGVTDKDGMLILSKENLLSCTKRHISNKVLNEDMPAGRDPDDEAYDQEYYGFVQPPTLILIVSKGDDWTYLRAQGEGNPSVWNFGVSSAWEAERPIPAGTIFSDRDIYRLGETVELKAVFRYLHYGELKKDIGGKYNITLTDPNGGIKGLQDITLSEFGTFHFSLPVQKNWPLGHYRIIAKNTDKDLSYSGTFRVEQFRAPDFKAGVKPEKDIVFAGSGIKADVQAEYYFGAPMSGAPASWRITRYRTYFTPKGLEEFHFGTPEWIERENRAAEPTVNVAADKIELDKNGRGAISLPIAKGTIQRPMRYNIDVEVKDPSEQTVGASGYITALPYETLIGMKTKDWFGAANKPMTVTMIAADSKGNIKSGIKLKAKLFKRDWHAIERAVRTGEMETESRVVDKEVGRCEADSSDKPVSCDLIPQEAGYYIIEAGIKDKQNTGTEARLSFYATGKEMVGWQGTEYDRIEIVLDKGDYKPGDTARAFIKSPYPEAEMLFTVEREKFLFNKRQKVSGGAFIVEFTITKEMIPNAYAAVVLIRKGKPASGIEPIDDRQFKAGYAPFKVKSDEKRLTVVVAPDREKLRPSEDVKVDINLKDFFGKPVVGEVTVLVVDEAILALTGYSPPDLVSVIYPHRGLSVRINDNRRFLLHQQKFLEKGNDGGGGGFLTNVRGIFKSLAYFNPSLVTDADGHASVSFKLPDNLTKWRIMAVAVTKEDMFGNGQANVTTSLPLVLRSVFPRFARIGDRFKAGVTVQATGDAEGDVKIKMTPLQKDSSLILDAGAGFKPAPILDEVSIHLKPGETKKVLFPFKAKSIGEGSFQFSAHFEGQPDDKGQTIVYDDALSVKLNVQDIPPTETVVAVGETDKETIEKINIADNLMPDTGGLQIRISSTALSQINEGARYLVGYPYGCIEQTISRLLPLMQIQELSKIFKFDLKATKPILDVIDANMQKVLSLQNADGGFKYWSSDMRSEPYASAYAAKLFNRAAALNYNIPDDAKNRLADYLQKALHNPPHQFWSWQSLAEYRLTMLFAINDIGRWDESYYQELFNRRKELSFGGQMALDYLLTELDRKNAELRMLKGRGPVQTDNRATILFEEIKNGMFITAQTAHFEDRSELPPSWAFMHSPVITTARGLLLFLKREPESQFISKMAKYILNARKNGRWRHTYENAQAIDSLIMILKTKEAVPPDYTAQVILAGKKIAESVQKGYDANPFEAAVKARELPQGISEIRIQKSGSGALYYTMFYSYKKAGAEPSMQEGFYIERKITRFGKGDEDKEILKAKLGDVVQVDITVIVPQAAHRFVVDSPIPAGLEPIDTSLKTTTSRRYETDSGRQGRKAQRWGWEYTYNPFNHVERHDDSVKLFADEITAGVYHYKYLARVTTPGVFEYPGSTATLMYEPEQFGRSGEGVFEVAE